MVTAEETPRHHRHDRADRRRDRRQPARQHPRTRGRPPAAAAPAGVVGPSPRAQRRARPPRTEPKQRQPSRRREPKSRGRSRTTTSAAPKSRPSRTITVNGSVIDTMYGPVQVQVTVRGSRIVSAHAIDYPQGGGRDQEINSRAIPQLDKETIAGAERADRHGVRGDVHLRRLPPVAPVGTRRGTPGGVTMTTATDSRRAPQRRGARGTAAGPRCSSSIRRAPTAGRAAAAGASRGHPGCGGANAPSARHPAESATTVVNGTSVDTRVRTGAGAAAHPRPVASCPRRRSTIRRAAAATAQINSFAIPILQKETVAAQSAQIDTVSGATFTSDGYRTSLQAALDAAHL